ncbi:MAG: hypothetical protein M1839_004106 [Geoglossum umbratile]|nr:MAG: hypothetical protein M1839_004106 [Geoglossum umbratile]
MTNSDSDIIASKPIGEGLDGFRRLFRSTCVSLGISKFQDAPMQVGLFVEATGTNDLMLDLLLALQNLPAARFLRSRNGHKSILRDLFDLGSQADSGDFDVKSVIPLLEGVIGGVSDLEIWNTVFTLVAPPKATTPLIVFNRVILDTPLKSTSGSQHGKEQIHKKLDERILQEVNGCVYNDTKGFYEKYFEGKSWSSTAEQIIRDANLQTIDGRWMGYPNPPSQSAFLEWFWRFQSAFLSRGRSMYYTSYKRSLNGSDCGRQPDLFVAPSGTTKCSGRYNWVDVRVIGELKESVSKNYPDDCEKFDLHKNPDRFIKVIIGYTMMSDEELSLSTYIKEDKHGKYIMFKAEGKTKEEKLCLEDEPIALQYAIVCRGTTCYRAKRLGAENWEFVVKFSWQSDKRRAEGELLRLTKGRGVWGVARLFGYQDLDSIANLRQRLQFGKPRWFPSATSRSISQTQSRTKSIGSKKSRSRSAGLGIGGVTLESSSSGQKRKRHGEVAELHQSTRSRSGSSRRRADITSQVTAEQGGGAEGANKYSVEEPKVTSLMPPRDANDESFDNRIFCCLVVSPPGRAIHEFESVLEFLEVCRDVIKGHRSLYQDGRILHRDVSVNNVTITNAENEEDPRGMLIDLDLAKELGSGPSGARHRTGTMEFMAIEVLKGKAHTYRHDLESFFYVFLWVIIRYGQETDNNLPTKSRLQGWYTGTYDEIARNKTGDMDKKAFKDIVAEFPLQFEGVKHLAEELRYVLFPIQDEALFTGTYGEPKWINSIYDSMVNAFDSAIETYQQ